MPSIDHDKTVKQQQLFYSSFTIMYIHPVQNHYSKDKRKKNKNTLKLILINEATIKMSHSHRRV